MKNFLLFLIGLLLSAKGYSQQSINIYYANDSLYWVGCPSATPLPQYDAFTLRVLLTGYSLTDTFAVKADFGDGTYQMYYMYSQGGLYVNSQGHLAIDASFSHNYLAAGMYDVTYYVYDPSGNVVSLFHPAEVILTNNCSTFAAHVFVDNNSNCIYDSGDSLITNVPLTIRNGIATYGIYYYPYTGSSSLPLGVNFTASIDAAFIQQLGYSVTCPGSGMINFTASGNNTLDFAVNCNSNYDVAINSGLNAQFKLNNSFFVGVAVSDVSCIPMSGTYSLTLDPKLTFVAAMSPPASGSGQNFTWNYNNLVTIGNGIRSIGNFMYFNLNPSAQLGDTLCYTFTATPTAGDINPSNNTITACGPVVSAFDPNFKSVNPKGVGPNGSILPNTKLTYTIGFQNTGNDTATNVYVIDTLDLNLNVNSIRVLYASHPMQLYIIDGHILKFDFRNIFLPDSGHNEMLSHGFIVYEINPTGNLANGTPLQNTAHIYFDSNAPVATNSTLNTINTALALYENVNEAGILYPNPVTKMMNIDFKERIDGNIELLDMSGRIIEKSVVSGFHFQEDLGQLEDGFYMIVVRNTDGNAIVSKKLLKN